MNLIATEFLWNRKAVVWETEKKNLMRLLRLSILIDRNNDTHKINSIADNLKHF